MQIITYAENRLVKRHRGTMPVILTSPHGGSESPTGVSERSPDSTPEGCDFNIASDLGTARITEAVAQILLNISGLSPYVVCAKFHRKFIDANRPAACAFTDPKAQPFYDEYHNRIAGYITQILEQNQNRGFLLDIHGTAVLENDPADIYLGTVNGDTLPPPFDRRDMFSQHGLHGLLKSSRHPTVVEGLDTVFQYRVSPADATTPETIAGASRLNSTATESTAFRSKSHDRSGLMLKRAASLLRTWPFPLSTLFAGMPHFEMHFSNAEIALS